MASPEKELEEILKKHTDNVLTEFMEEFGNTLSEYQIAVLVASYIQEMLNEVDNVGVNWTVTLTDINKDEEEDSD